jgi:hypothetical protein
MRQNLYAVEPAPPLPGMPFQGLVFMRILEAGEVCNLQRLQDGTVAGESNGNWKGGQTRHKAGYIMARAPGHPRAAGSGSHAPTGIRASDAVAWARHILELYGGLDTSNNAQGLH